MRVWPVRSHSEKRIDAKGFGMSEPQHPQPQDTDMNEGRPASVARAVVQPVGQPGLDSLAAVGARLTQLRESKNWSIEDVSPASAWCPPLRALEAGDISHLPDTTFALGVVRSYAKMLGADPTPFTQALRARRACLRRICRCRLHRARICRAAACRCRSAGARKEAARGCGASRR